MKIRAVSCNNRKKAFEIKTSAETFVFPYAKADPEPTAQEPVERVFVDEELDREGFTYVLASGRVMRDVMRDVVDSVDSS